MPTGLGGEKLWLCPTLEGENLDLSGNGNHGTYYGGMGTVADKYKGNRAFGFNSSSNQYVSVSTLDMRNLTKFSWSAWIRNTRVTGNNTIFFSSSSSGGSEYLYDNFIFYRNVSTGRAWVAVDNNSDGKGDGGVFPNGVWNHAAVVFDGNGSTNSQRLRYFLNGEEVSMTYDYTVPSVTPNRATTNVLIGGYAYNLNANGAMDGQQDDIRVFERTLSPSEIKHLSSYRGVLGSPYYKPPTVKSRVTRLLSDRDTTEPPTETATSGLIRLKSPKQTQPSYKAGYAKSASESASPELWDGLRGAWVPELGPTGTKVFDASGRSHNALLTNMDPATDWVRQGEHAALDFDGISNYLEVEESSRAEWAFVQNTLDFTISLRFRVNELGTRDILFGTSAASTEKGFQAAVQTDGRLQFLAFNSVGPSTADRTVTYAQSESGSINALQWHSVVIVGNSETLECRILVDGVDTTSFVYPFSGFATGDSTRSLNIGRTNHSSTIDPLDGQIASFAIWDKSLGSTSVKRLSADPLAPFRQRRYAPVSLPTEEPPVTFNHWYAMPGRINRIVGSGVHV